MHVGQIVRGRGLADLQGGLPGQENAVRHSVDAPAVRHAGLLQDLLREDVVSFPAGAPTCSAVVDVETGEPVAGVSVPCDYAHQIGDGGNDSRPVEVALFQDDAAALAKDGRLQFGDRIRVTVCDQGHVLLELGLGRAGVAGPRGGEEHPTDEPATDGLVGKPTVLPREIDGRYTLFEGKPPPFYEGESLFFDLHFNVQTQEFRFYQKSQMLNNPAWVSVHDFLGQGLGTFVSGLHTMAKERRETLEPNLARLADLDGIRNYTYRSLWPEARGEFRAFSAKPLHALEGEGALAFQFFEPARAAGGQFVVPEFGSLQPALRAAASGLHLERGAANLVVRPIQELCERPLHVVDDALNLGVAFGTCLLKQGAWHPFV